MLNNQKNLIGEIIFGILRSHCIVICFERNLQMLQPSIVSRFLQMGLATLYTNADVHAYANRDREEERQTHSEERQRETETDRHRYRAREYKYVHRVCV